MTGQAWQDNNNRYLAASLEWLRCKLERCVSAAAGESAGAADMEEAAARRDEAARSDPPPALLVLAERMGLSEFERDSLLLCAAAEFDTGMAAQYARAQGSPNRAYPTFGLALAALDNPAWDALAAYRPLRRAHLVEIYGTSAATPLTSTPLRVDERIVNFLKGLNEVDERLAAVVTAVRADGQRLSPTQTVVAEALVERVRYAKAPTPVAQLAGDDGGSKLAVAREAAMRLNRRLYRIAAEALPPEGAESQLLARLWQRETLLLPVALYVDAENLEITSTEPAAALARFLADAGGLIFVAVRDAPLRLEQPSFLADVRKPSAEEQSAAWVRFLSAAAEDAQAAVMAEELAGQFDLNLDDITEAASLALPAGAMGEPLKERMWSVCRDLRRPRLASLAQRLEPKATWDELVLPKEQIRLMRRIGSEVRERHRVYGRWGFARRMNRGFGISVLFTGESGTGKTMAAEVLANDLRLDLYRIDLAAVVSKYIGETEKNLRRVFDAAEQGGAILFFDEADALFGKRSEVKDSHDRYANIEINYLLQRMEGFRGLAILATNLKNGLDPAFLRRLRFVVRFSLPGPVERRAIWERAFPAEVPREELDLDRLARLNVAGGNIHNIALHAAFLAAESNQKVTMKAVLAAARAEFQKLERPVREVEFR